MHRILLAAAAWLTTAIGAAAWDGPAGRSALSWLSVVLVVAIAQGLWLKATPRRLLGDAGTEKRGT